MAYGAQKSILQNPLLGGQGSVALIDAWVGKGKLGFAFFYVFVSIPNWELLDF